MNITGKYLKIWKIEVKSGYTFLNLGDSRKDKNGVYENCTWFGCILLGKAAEKTFTEGDLVEVKSAQIFMEQWNGKWSPKIKIFHIELMEVEGNGQERQEKPLPQQQDLKGSNPVNDFEDDIPF